MSKTAIIDLDSVCYSIAHPHKVLDEKGEPIKKDDKFVYKDKTYEEMDATADHLMQQILLKSGATHYLAFMKGLNTSDRRRRDNPEYKANRSAEEPWWWKRVQNYLFNRWKAKYVNDIEVDDAVNIARLALPDAFICAIDKDLLGLEGNHYNWRKDEWVHVTEDEAIHKFWTDMIAGQPGDNIKGLPRKGPAYAANLFKQEYGRKLSSLVFALYVDVYGEIKGVKEFYANYMALKILDKFDHFNIPEPVRFELGELEINAI